MLGHVMRFIAGRTRAACDLLAQYLSPDMRASLVASYEYVLLYMTYPFSSYEYISFTELDAHFKSAENETAAMAAVKENGKVKKKATTGTEEKKRKNSKGSQGVEKLKKANVNGMAKLSSFYKKS